MALNLGELVATLGLETGPFDKGLDKSGEKLKESDHKFAKIAGGLGVGVATGLAAGLVGAMDMQGANAKLQAQLGLNASDSKKLGAVAGKLYAQNYGDNMEDIDEAIAAVVQNIDGMRGASKKSLMGISADVISVSKTFGTDFGETTKSVGQLMKTGLAKNASQALDIITKGMQNGDNKAGDLLDTFNEYPTQFRKLGLDGKTALGLIDQGLKGGARDSDLVADSLKEFSIRAVDGSTTTAAGFKSIGLNAKDMAERIGKGGKSASSALDETLKRIRGIKDPVKQSQAAVALFGTQAEDMGKALYNLDPSKAVKSLGQVDGAAHKVSTTLGKTASANIQGFVRQIRGKLITVVGGLLLPAFTKLTSVLNNDLGPAFKLIGSTIVAVSKWIAQNKTLVEGIVAVVGGAAIAWGVWTLAIIAYQYAAKIATATTAAFNAVMDANPIMLVVIGLAALAAGFIYAYKHSETFRTIVQEVFNTTMGVVMGFVHFFTQQVPAAFSAVIDFVKAHWQLILGIITAPIGGIYLLIFHFRKQIVGLFTGLWSDVKGITRRGAAAVVSFFTKLPGQAWRALGNLGGYLTAKGQALISGMWNGSKAQWNRAVKWIAGLGTSALRWIGNLGKTLYSKGVAIITGFMSGATLKGAQFLAWVMKLPGRALNALGNLGSYLRSKGSALLGGFMDAATLKGAQFLSWMMKLPGKAVSAIGNVGTLLYAKGKALAGGLGDGAGAALRKVEDAFLTPLNWIGRKIINPFLGTLHHYLSKIGFPDWSVPTPLIKARATGGPLNPGDLSWVGEHGRELAQIMPGGGVRIHSNAKSEKMAKQMGPAANKLPGFFLGGVIGKIKDVGSWTFDETKKGAKAGIKGGRWLAGTAVGAAVRTAEKAANAAVGQIPGTSVFRSMGDKVMQNVANGVENWIKGKGSAAPKSGINIPKGSAVGRWTGVVTDVLKELHQSLEWVGPYLSLIKFESGGNPKAVNKTDINWQRGYPSVGLGQVIRPTFQRWAGKYAKVGPMEYGVSENPHANLFASANYGVHNYGSIGNIPGIRSLLKGGGYKPYDSGGWLMPGGNGRNFGRKPEAVLTPEESRAFVDIARHYASSGGGSAAVEIGAFYAQPAMSPRDVAEQFWALSKARR